MIDTKELRIGNYVGLGLLNQEPTLHEVTSIERLSICLKPKGRVADAYYRVQNIYPIPITEEWLVKIGFKTTNHLNYWLYDKNDCYVEGNLTLNGFEWDFDGRIINTSRYIHQLQNFFFFFEGKELEIKS